MASRSASPSSLIFLELNEINFDFVEAYGKRGLLPNLNGLIHRHGISRTTSETDLERIEPWIQWVTAHTGMAFDQHGVYRLGDIAHHDIPQIWETLETAGYRVGAVSPMNAKHRLRAPAFFVPDPWTQTSTTGRPALVRLHRALARAVNDNAQRALTGSSMIDLLVGALVYARPVNYPRYAKLAASGHWHPWRRAMVLDLLLADVFMREVRRSRPDFATLFLNAAAHIQHHYMFCAAPYEGQRRNPTWYVRPGVDPVLEVYELYDDIVGDVLRQRPETRLMLATGLHQDPHSDVTFYWRLRDHARFLARIGVPFERVEPRMSRDFLVVCHSENEARTAADLLSAATAADGEPIFAVDNRGTDLFVMLAYPREIVPGLRFSIGERTFDGLHDDVVFVALKNGEHNGIGYFIDTHDPAATRREFPLEDVHARVLEAFAVQPAEDSRTYRRAASA
jgi:hypothetical protein